MDFSMGWWMVLLKRIQDLFNSEPEVEIIPIAKVGIWLQEQRQKIMQSIDFLTMTGEYKQSLQEKRWFLECSIDDWEKALPLQHQDVRHFLVQTRSVLDKITFPDEDDFRTLLAFNKKLGKELEIVIENIEESPFAKTYDFLFFKNSSHVPVNPLLKELLEIKALCDLFEQKLLKHGLLTADILEKKHLELVDAEEKRQCLQEKISERKERFQAAERRKKEKEEEILRLKSQEQYTSSMTLLATKEDLQKRLHLQTQKIALPFAVLKPVLEDYAEMSGNSPLVDNYSRNPLLALDKDEGLTITHLLQHLKATILNQKISCREDLAGASLKAIDDLQRDKLELYQKECYVLKKELEQVEDLLKKQDLLQKIEEEEYRLKHFKEQTVSLQNTLAQFEEQFEQRTEEINQKKELFEHLVRMSFNKRIKVEV